MDATSRFTGRATAYERARPSYPRAVIDLLDEMCDLHTSRVVADLGSGTGIFARLLVDEGLTVIGVEPNADMRAVAERDLATSRNFRSVAGRAEATGLADGSVDLVVAAQAFHWFDAEKTRREALRILRTTGKAALVWNDRDKTSTPFARDFEALLLATCPDYPKLQGSSANVPRAFDAFFGPGGFQRRSVANGQTLDRDGLVDRVRSASYAPTDDRALVEGLDALFAKNAEDGKVTILYDCVVIAGRPRS